MGIIDRWRQNCGVGTGQLPRSLALGVQSTAMAVPARRPTTARTAFLSIVVSGMRGYNSGGLNYSRLERRREEMQCDVRKGFNRQKNCPSSLCHPRRRMTRPFIPFEIGNSKALKLECARDESNHRSQDVVGRCPLINLAVVATLVPSLVHF